MLTLSGAFKLGQKVKVYVPGEDENGNKLSTGTRAFLVEFVSRELSKVAGGATAYPARGYWVGSEKLFKEDVTVVESFCKEDTLENVVETALECVGKIFEVAKQEAVSVEVNGELYIVDSSVAVGVPA